MADAALIDLRSMFAASAAGARRCSDDYGLCKAYAVALRKRSLPSPRTLERHGEKWRPYRIVASWYLGRTLDQPPI